MKLRCITAVAGGFLATALSLQAQFVWVGTTGSLENAANWSPVPTPITQLINSNLTFGNATTTAIVLDTTAINSAFGISNGTVVLNSVSFTSATANYSFSGTGTPTLAITGGVSLTAANPNAVAINSSLKVNLAGAALQTLNIASGATLNVLSDISGTGAGLVKTGTGTLLLGGTNTYNGFFNGTDTQGTIVRAGTLQLSGGSITHNSAHFIVGNISGDNGTAVFSGGGDVSDSNGYIGAAAGSTGTVTVTGTGSTWSNTTYLYVGAAGTGTLNIASGGAVLSVDTSVGNTSGGNGTIFVNGTGSSLSNTSTLYVGAGGNGALTVTNGGSVTDATGVIGNNSGGTGVATIDGTGSTWSNTNQLIVGNTSPGTLIVTNGGTVTNGIGTISGNTAATSTAIVTGAGSTWSNSTSLRVGFSGIGNLTIANGGLVNVQLGDGTLTLGSNATGNGTLNIGAAASGAPAAGGYLNAAAVTTGAGTGTVQFKTTATSAAPYYFTSDGTANGFSVAINGTTSVINTGGYNVVASPNTYSGGTTINGGTLVANASNAFGTGTITLNGGSLGVGTEITLTNPITFTSGRIGGNGTLSTLSVGTNAVLAPGNSVGTLTFSNGLTLASSGGLDFEVQSALGTPGSGFDTLSVSGTGLTISATTTSQFKIKVLSLSAGIPGTVGDFNSANSYSWAFVTSNGGIAGFTGSNQFLIDTTGFANALNGGFFTVTQGTYSGLAALYLNFTPVPEPSTYALLVTGLGAVLLPALRRRQRQRR